MFLGKLRNLSRKGRVAVASLVTIVMVAGFSLIGASSASASEGQCVGPFWGMLQQDICMVADLQGKDYAHHRQWVGWVTATEPGPAPDELLEIWGDGFYYNSRGTTLTRNINKWVRSGTYICGAETDHEGVREIACVGIHV